MKFNPFPGQVHRKKTLKKYAFVKELIVQWLRSFVTSSSPIMPVSKENRHFILLNYNTVRAPKDEMHVGNMYVHPTL